MMQRLMKGLNAQTRRVLRFIAKIFSMLAAFVFIALIGGSTNAAINTAVGDGGYPPNAAIALRFGGACLLYWTFYFAMKLYYHLTKQEGKLDWSWQQAMLPCLAGVCSAVAHLFIYSGLQHIRGGLPTVIGAISPLLAGFLAAKTNTEHNSRTTIGGCVLALCGVSIVFVDRWLVSNEFVALGQVAIAMPIFAVSNVALKRQHVGRKAPPVSVQGGLFFLAAWPIPTIYHLCSAERPFPWTFPALQTWAVLYTIVGVSGIGFTLYLWLMGTTNMVKTMTTAFLQPLIALAIDAIIEGRTVGANAWVGSAIVITGVVLQPLLILVHLGFHRLARGKPHAATSAGKERITAEESATG